jgi:hypothetical protein
MRTNWSRIVTLSLISFLCLFGIAGICSSGAADDDMVTVQGIGYPPIRAESAAQAHLLAKRAAVVDAYRNALSGRASSLPGPDVTYQELSGFVSGMTVTGEEFLDDGGIRITGRVPKKNVVSSSGLRTEVRRGEGLSEGSRGPERVSLDEWYKIINNLVRIDK